MKMGKKKSAEDWILLQGTVCKQKEFQMEKKLNYLTK